MSNSALILTVHVPLMLVLDERVAPGLRRPLVVDDINLEQSGTETLVCSS